MATSKNMSHTPWCSWSRPYRNTQVTWKDNKAIDSEDLLLTEQENEADQSLTQYSADERSSSQDDITQTERKKKVPNRSRPGSTRTSISALLYFTLLILGQFVSPSSTWYEEHAI
ncbi:unnamed protein product [Hermetia illucens]|uniref:Uncharacterized protein n=1 Tax=Hermetia illucens TaxID=343691 RepID=A0A7R8YZL0_HERIL|nr:unnamed protein product [Hermetia illucens]